MNITAIIPARGGSKGILRKNIKLLNGKPLIVYSIESALLSKYITRVFVSTEDEEIANVAREYCDVDIVKRPIKLAQDDTKTAPVIEHAINNVYHTPDIICLLQPTSPFREPFLIDSILGALVSVNKDSAFTAFRTGITHGLWKIDSDFKVSSLYDYHNRPRRQDLDLHQQMYCEDGAFYAIKYDAWLKTKDFIGSNPLICERERSIDIDTVEDWIKAENYLKNKESKYD